MAIRGYVFDAYGTLFDVHSVVEAARAITPDPMTLSLLWRQKQLEYTWLRSLMGRYEDFWAVTESALRHALGRLSIAAAERDLRSLMDAYLSLACFPEVEATLRELQGRPVAILSNGSPRMLQEVTKNAGIDQFFAHIISVDEIKIYKPSPRVYQLASKKLGTAAEVTGFVSSNSWDVAGASSFGLTTFWINRAKAPPDELGFQGDRVVSKLTDLLPLLKGAA